MMKKITAIVLTAAVGSLVLFGAVQVSAKAQAAPPGPNPEGPGTGPRGYGRGMMGAGTGLMHDYMVEALAVEFDLDVDEINALHESGETLRDFAQEAGLTVEEFQSRMAAARESALAAAAEDGVISQEQADWMTERWEHFENRGYGPGYGPCHDGSFRGGMMPGRSGSRGMGHW